MRLIIALLFFVFTFNLTAQETLSDSLDTGSRIVEINTMLRKAQKPLNTWWYGWLGLYSTATIAQGMGYAFNDDKRNREDMALGAATTLLGAGLQLLGPINTGKDADLLDQLPENSMSEAKMKLDIAEKLLEANAEKEKFGRSWQMHTMNTAVNLGTGLITWLGFKRTLTEGAIVFLMNSVITETQIWTQPTRTIKDFEAYNRKYKSANKLSFKKTIQPEFYLSAHANGVALKVVF